ncbi:MAG: hypothetical protein IH621_13425 [Krumholzibacteria bacterium]|nr:hypothetical protein [Candidatus Krumholzibacteria bacterium]
MVESNSDRTRHQANGDGDLVDIWFALRRSWRLLALAVLAGAAIGVAIALISPPVYEATVTILPGEQGPEPGIFGAVAAMTGLSLQGATSYEEIYGRILVSDWLLDQLLARSWPAGSGTGTGADSLTLHELVGLDPPGGEGASRIADEKAKRRLRNSVLGFFRDTKSGFMILSVKLERQPVAAAALANHCAGLLDVFNRQVRSSKAKDHRIFCEVSLADVAEELKALEQDLTAFLEENRTYASSPALLQQFGRLQREVEAQTTVWVELRKQYELARLEENKSSISIDVLDEASVPLRPVAPRRAFLVVVWAFLGGVVGVVVAFYRLVVRRRYGHG